MESFDIWNYLINVAPVVVVMAIAIVALWKKVNFLLNERSENDKANLETLSHLSNALKKLSEDGNRNFSELKNHVNDRVEIIVSHLKDRE